MAIARRGGGFICRNSTWKWWVRAEVSRTSVSPRWSMASWWHQRTSFRKGALILCRRKTEVNNCPGMWVGSSSKDTKYPSRELSPKAFVPWLPHPRPHSTFPDTSHIKLPADLLDSSSFSCNSYLFFENLENICFQCVWFGSTLPVNPTFSKFLLLPPNAMFSFAISSTIIIVIIIISLS